MSTYRIYFIVQEVSDKGDLLRDCDYGRVDDHEYCFESDAMQACEEYLALITSRP